MGCITGAPKVKITGFLDWIVALVGGLMKIAFISSLKGTSCSLNIVLRRASIFVSQGFLLLLGQYKPIQPGPASGTFTTLHHSAEVRPRRHAVEAG